MDGLPILAVPRTAPIDRVHSCVISGHSSRRAAELRSQAASPTQTPWPSMRWQALSDQPTRLLAMTAPPSHPVVAKAVEADGHGPQRQQEGRQRLSSAPVASRKSLAPAPATAAPPPACPPAPAVAATPAPARGPARSGARCTGSRHPLRSIMAPSSTGGSRCQPVFPGIRCCRAGR